MTSTIRISPSSAASHARYAAICTSVLTLLGCASIAGVGGSAEFGCKAPVGVKCDSVSGTYYNALQQNLPSQQNSALAAPNVSVTPTLAPPGYSATDAALVNTPVTPLGAMREAGAPLRSAPRVLRLWIKQWEDSEGDLHSQSYVYVPIDTGHWLIDRYRSLPRDAYAPIKAQRAIKGAAPRVDATVTANSPRAREDASTLAGSQATDLARPSSSGDGDDDGK